MLHHLPAEPGERLGYVMAFHTGTNLIHLVYLTGWEGRFLRKKARFAKISVEC